MIVVSLLIETGRLVGDYSWQEKPQAKATGEGDFWVQWDRDNFQGQYRRVRTRPRANRAVHSLADLCVRVDFDLVTKCDTPIYWYANKMFIYHVGIK